MDASKIMSAVKVSIFTYNTEKNIWGRMKYNRKKTRNIGNRKSKDTHHSILCLTERDLRNNHFWPLGVSRK